MDRLDRSMSPDFGLDGKVALVTGASGEIGREVARRLAACGATVLVHCNSDLAAAQALADEIEGAGSCAHIAGGDLSGQAAIQLIVIEIESRFGRLDVLVSNAGISTPASVKSDGVALVQAFARELGSRRIRGNAVASCGTRAPMTDWIDPAIMQGVADQTLLGKVVVPSSVPDASFFVAAEQGRVAMVEPSGLTEIRCG